MNNTFRFLLAIIVFFAASVIIGGLTLEAVAGAGIVSLILATVFKPIYETKEKTFFHGVDENKKSLPIILAVVFGLIGGLSPLAIPLNILCPGPCFGAVYFFPLFALIGLIAGFFIGGIISLISSRTK